MKTLLFLLLTISTAAYAEPLIVFKTKLEITSKCQIKYTKPNGKVNFVKLSLPESSNCKFIMYDESNLIHMEQISNFYMFLIESTSSNNEGCLSEHTAVAVKDGGVVVPAEFSKKSLSCNIDREQKLFHHFAYEMKLIK